MRVSVIREDPGYRDWATLCKVWLNGVEVFNVVTADEERRYALTYRLDTDGRIVIKDDRLVHDEFYGHVRIEAPLYVCEATL